jgi:hypothetical protein
MLAVIYLLVCMFFGVQLLRILFPDPQRLFVGIAPRKETVSLIPTNLFIYPAGFLVGLILITTVTYFLGYIMTPFIPSEMPVLYPANVVSLCAAIYFGSLFWQKCFARRNAPAPESKPAADSSGAQTVSANGAENAAPPKEKFTIQGFVPTKGSVLFYVLPLVFLAAALTFLFFYSFHVTDHHSLAGFSVYSDLSPHTAILSSFSHGMNFPTEYPHFPGDGIRYHFLFYFLSGNLNLLGMQIDFALNIPSILTGLSCLTLLGVLAVLLSGRRMTFILAPVLVLFRSSYAIVSQISALAKAPGATFESVMDGILKNTSWIGTTTYDNWGLWAVNVYANQRHLLLGIGLVLILLFLFLPHVRRMFLHVRKAKGAGAKLYQFFISPEAWLPRKKDPIRPYALGLVALIIVICMPYFHGSSLIAGLLILFFMSIFSENRITYAVVAAAAVLSSYLQSVLFSGGPQNVVSFTKQFGFIVADPTFMNVAIYLAKIMGIALILLIIYLVVEIVLLFMQKNGYRTVLVLAFAMPAVFAFVVRTSVDITANHKFIQISIILFSVYIASVLAFLWKPMSTRLPVHQPSEITDTQAKPAGNHPVRSLLLVLATRILAVLLFFTLTATGISEWIVYYNINKNSVSMNLKSLMNQWVEQNTRPKDVILTAPYSMNTILLSGRSIFYGHPYYAWSAGYDTDERKVVYAELLSGCDGDVLRFRELCAQNDIAYILIDNTLRFPDPSAIEEGFILNETFFVNNFKIAASFPNENDSVIYSVT